MPVIPERTTLYRLQPIGIGTGWIESFSGYLQRLAEAHHVSPGVLMARMIIADQCENPWRYAWYGDNFDGVGANPALTARVEALTGAPELGKLTARRFGGFLPDRHLMRGYRAWCPRCYRDDRFAGESVYDRLAWRFRNYTICTLHHVEIEPECGNCHKPQRTLGWKGRPGHCSRCGAWLGQASMDHPETNSTWGLWQSAQVERLCGYIPSRSRRTSLPEMLAELRRRLGLTSNAAFGSSMGFSRGQLSDYLSGHNRPSLESVLRICARAGLHVDDLLEGRFQRVQLQLDVDAPSTLKPRRGRPVDRAAVGRQVALALDADPPIGVTEAARRCGVDRRLLWLHFRTDCARLRARAREHRSHEVASKRRSLEDLIEGIVTNLVSQGLRPTRHHVQDRLTRPGLMRRAGLIRFHAQLVRQLGFEDCVPRRLRPPGALDAYLPERWS